MPATSNKPRRSLHSLIQSAICTSALGLFLVTRSSGIADEDKPANPATVAEAAQLIDLATFPLFEETESPSVRRLAQLVYQTKGTIKATFDFQKAKLAALKFEELADSQISEQAASAVFVRDDFLVSVAVSVVDSAIPDILLVTLTNHGNVNLAKLPVPDGARNLNVTPLSTAYVTESTRSVTAEAVRKLLVAQGWQPLGRPGKTWREYKRNAVLLLVSVNSDPAQGGKTVIEYTCDLMSVDLPISSEFRHAAYSDPIKRLNFLTDQSPEDVAAFYREELGKSGWKPSIDRPTKLQSIERMIFRNPQQEMLILEMETTANAFLNGKLTYYSAVEVKDLSRMQRGVGK